MGRENRYLLFLTENYAALEILQQYLQDQESGHPSLNVHPEQPSLKPWEMAPFVLFGSSFPKDKEYTQVKSPPRIHLVVPLAPHVQLWVLLLPFVCFVFFNPYCTIVITGLSFRALDF